jgi:hypothetical protein
MHKVHKTIGSNVIHCRQNILEATVCLLNTRLRAHLLIFPVDRRSKYILITAEHRHRHVPNHATVTWT